MTTSPSKFERPFPALTPEQRYRFEVFGYVLIEDALTPEEVVRTRDAAKRLRDELCSRFDPANPTRMEVRGARFTKYTPTYQLIQQAIEAEPELTAYACHPRLVGMCEELIGAQARITQVDAFLNSASENIPAAAPDGRYGFHAGVDIPFGSHIQNGLFHCNFVKTFTYLTDIGPDDGGTVVIVGSHKVNAPIKNIINLAYQNPTLIHKVTARAGSTLLFPETLIHASGHRTTPGERIAVSAGYGPVNYLEWSRGDGTPMRLSNDFVARVPEPLHNLVHGRSHWDRNPRYRTLEQPADTRPIAAVPWPRPQNDRP